MKLICINVVLVLFGLGCNNQAKKRVNVKEIKTLYKVNVLSSYQHGDTLELVSDDIIVWQPFIFELSEDEFQKHYSNVFQVEKKNNIVVLQSDGNKINMEVNKPIENVKELAEYHHSEIPSHSIKAAKISTPLIELQHGIRVGMDKEDFFKMINRSGIENKINVVQLFDPPGDLIEQSYVFEDGKLKIIEMKSPY
jgi:hypothetical protein